MHAKRPKVDYWYKIVAPTSQQYDCYLGTYDKKKQVLNIYSQGDLPGIPKLLWTVFDPWEQYVIDRRLITGIVVRSGQRHNIGLTIFNPKIHNLYLSETRKRFLTLLNELRQCNPLDFAEMLRASEEESRIRGKNVA